MRFKVVDELLPAGKVKEELERALDLAARAITEGRDTVHGLRSSTVETNDLARIGALGEEFAVGENQPEPLGILCGSGRHAAGPPSNPPR